MADVHRGCGTISLTGISRHSLPRRKNLLGLRSICHFTGGYRRALRSKLTRLFPPALPGSPFSRAWARGRVMAGRGRRELRDRADAVRLRSLEEMAPFPGYVRDPTDRPLAPAPNCRIRVGGRTPATASPPSPWRIPRCSSFSFPSSWSTDDARKDFRSLQLSYPVRDGWDPDRQPHPQHLRPGTARHFDDVLINMFQDLEAKGRRAA